MVGYSKLPLMLAINKDSLDINKDLLDFSGDSLNFNKDSLNFSGGDLLDFSNDSLDFSGDSLDLNDIVVQQHQNKDQSNRDVIEFSKSLESFNFSEDSIKTSSNTDEDSSFGGNTSEGEWCLGNFKTFGNDGSLEIPEWFQPLSSSSSIATDLGDITSIGEVDNLLSIVSSSTSESVVGDDDAVLVQKSSSLLNLLEEDNTSLLSKSSVSISLEDSLNEISEVVGPCSIKGDVIINEDIDHIFPKVYKHIVGYNGEVVRVDWEAPYPGIRSDVVADISIDINKSDELVAADDIQVLECLIPSRPVSKKQRNTVARIFRWFGKKMVSLKNRF